MELAIESKTGFTAQYSPTSTPLLDVLRPLPRASREKLAAGEYFLVTSIIILTLIELPKLRHVSELLVSGAATFVGFCAFFLLVPAAGLAAAFAAHEGGRLLAAALCGFRLVQVKAGRFGFGRRAADPELQLGDVLPLGIAVLEPQSTEHLRRRLLVVLTAGFAGNALLSVGFEGFLYVARAGFLVSFSLHTAAALSLLYGLSTLLPDVNGKGKFSDGARLLMLLKNDARAQRWIATIELQLAFNRGEHPRRWAENLVIRAAGLIDDSRDTVVAQWLAYLWAAQRQDITSATRYLEEAFAALVPSGDGLRDRMFLEAAVFQAWFRDNPAKARAWLSQIREGQLTTLQRLRLDVALLWAEGKLFDAWEKLGEYFVLLQKLPPSTMRDLAENSAREWKKQMESRMLTRAWRTMYSLSQEVSSAHQTAETVS